MGVKKILGSVLISSFLFSSGYANSIVGVEHKVLDFINQNTPKDIQTKFLGVKTIVGSDGWYGVLVEFNKDNQKSEEIFLTNGVLLAQNIINLESNLDFRAAATESFAKVLDDSVYKKENIIYGNEGAKNKIVIFSNPLCPHCLKYMAELEKHIKDNKDIVVYHYPVLFSELAFVDEALISYVETLKVLKKDKSLDWKLYRSLYENQELYDLALKGETLEVIKKIFGNNITTEMDVSIVKQKRVSDENIVNSLNIEGTPTIYINGNRDVTLKRVFSIRGE